ncbi:MAG: YchJ family metal-binding protein [Aliarcobacter sp.]|nr:YchJ family metal-binding protein [Aliarcobacter sp.]
MKFSANDNCPCGSLIKYKKCCKPFHEDIKTPINALELMKSRYCAYAIEKSEYIILTTHQNNRDFNTDTKVWNNDILDFSRNTKFEKLEILEFIDGQTESFVTFKANITQNKQDVSFIEKSRFVKENGKWQYIDGEFIN